MITCLYDSSICSAEIDYQIFERCHSGKRSADGFVKHISMRPYIIHSIRHEPIGSPISTVFDNSLPCISEGSHRSLRVLLSHMPDTGVELSRNSFVSWVSRNSVVR